MLKTTYILFFIIYTISTLLFAKLLIQLDVNKRVYNHIPGECSIIPNLPGALDFETNVHGRLFMTVNRMDNSSSNGHIFNYYSDNKTARELHVVRPIFISPSKLSIFSGKNQDNLFVLNKMKSNVEIFKIKHLEEHLKYVNTLRNTEFEKITSLAATSPKSFYFLKESIYENEYLRIIARILPIKTGQILFYDGSKIETTLWVPSPTDLTFDSFQRILYVSSFATNSILVYSVKNNLLNFDKQVDIGCSPTSIWKDIDGSMIITCHEVRLRFLMSFLNQHLTSPSKVIRVLIPLSSQKEPIISQLYSNDGASMSQANCAVRAGRSLLISEGKQILNCYL